MVTFIRHGKSEYNNKRLFQGQLDINLSDKGISDAEAKSKDFPKNFDVCFCSPLKRTKQTAEILVPYLNINFDDRIIERGMGDWEGTLITDDKLDLLGNNHVPPNGESLADIDSRVSEFLKMVKDGYADKNVVVVTHAGIIYSVGRLLQLDIENAGNLEMIEVEV